MQLARPKPAQPRKGLSRPHRPAALGASRSRSAQRVERGGRREATQGVSHLKFTKVDITWSCVLMVCALAW